MKEQMQENQNRTDLLYTTVNGNETSKICSRTYPHMSATSRLVDQINHSFTIVHAGIQ